MVNREIKVRKRAVKEEKEEIDGEIVRIRKGHPRTNLPVELPENPTWLKQPNVVTLMAGDFKTVQKDSYPSANVFCGSMIDFRLVQFLKASSGMTLSSSPSP